MTQEVLATIKIDNWKRAILYNFIILVQIDYFALYPFVLCLIAFLYSIFSQNVLYSFVCLIFRNTGLPLQIRYLPKFLTLFASNLSLWSFQSWISSLKFYWLTRILLIKMLYIFRTIECWSTIYLHKHVLGSCKIKCFLFSI